MANEIVVSGLPELHASLQGLGRELANNPGLNRDVAETLVAAVSEAAPKLTGQLAASFTASGTADEAKAESDLIYAPVINNGWREHNITPQHYAEQALAAVTPQVETQYSRGMDELTRKAEA